MSHINYSFNQTDDIMSNGSSQSLFFLKHFP